MLHSKLTIGEPSCHAQYGTGEQRWEHAAEIRTRYGYQDFSPWPTQFRLNRWLYALCWTGTDRPSILFDRATAWLVSHKILLPGVSVLERLVSRLPKPCSRAALAAVDQETDVTTDQNTGPGTASAVHTAFYDLPDIPANVTIRNAAPWIARQW